MRRALGVCVVAAVFAAACSLFVSLDGLGTDAGTVLDSATSDGAKSDAAPDDGALDGAADADASADSGAGCPSGRGPAMVEFLGHCIDSTEVTWSQYLAFVASVDGGVLSPECAFKTSFASSTGPPADTTRPVSHIDWCDAWAFCAWAGKELCGAIGGGPLAMIDYANPKKSLWMAACTDDGQLTYPYGNAFNATSCRLGVDGGASGTVPTGSLATCNGGFAGIFDMVGNIKEWERACAASTGRNDLCRRRGAGHTTAPSSIASCSYDETNTRDYRSLSSGIRCCAKP